MSYKYLFYLFFGLFLWSWSFAFLVQGSAHASTELTFRADCDSDCSDFEIINEEFVRYPSAVSTGDTFTVDIIVKNPQAQEIYSVSSWVKYDPKVFAVVELSDTESDFSLAAPGEFSDDADLGEIKIARAVAGFPTSELESKVATITFAVKTTPSNTSISFWDYQENGEGKTAVMTIENILPKNILNISPRSLQFVAATSTPTSTEVPVVPVATPAPTLTSTPEPTPESTPETTLEPEPSLDPIPTVTTLPTTLPDFIDIPRPEGLRARTNSEGQVELIWQFGEDPRIQGYFIYYDQTSQNYMHRRDVGRTNNYTFPKSSFEKGKRMYFTLKAYDITGDMSEFSREVYLVVGTPGSESHSFSGNLANNQVSLSDALIAPTPTPASTYSLNASILDTSTPSTGSPVDLLYIGGFFGTLLFLLLLRVIWRRHQSFYTPPD